MDIFTQLSLIVVTATVAAGAARLLKQPLTVAYIITGFVLAPFLFVSDSAKVTLDIFSTMGVAILLFIVGLHLSPRDVKSFAKISLLIGLLQVLFTTTLGFYLALLLGFSPVESIYIGVGVSFSSTIIVLKMISDKKDLEMLYGRVAIGILLLQDIIAALSLVFVAAFATSQVNVITLGTILAKGLFLIILTYTVGNYLLPLCGSFFAKSQEYLLLFSIAWGFGFAALFRLFDFSIELGALVAGVALSISPYSREISSRLRPLRDFFVLMFFVSLGSQLISKDIGDLWVPILALTLFTLVVKPFIVAALMGQFRYNKKTVFMGATSLAQMSEFSLILLLVGLRVGHVSNATFTAVLVSSVVSIAVSSYLISYAERLYPYVAKYFKVFERAAPIQERSIVGTYDVILFGGNRVGYDFVRAFKNYGAGFLVVDFDPAVMSTLEKSGINCMYGDAEDGEFLDDINVTQAKVVVSTIPDFDANAFLLNKIRAVNAQSLVVVLSNNVDDTLKLYELSASYVIVPHFISGEYSADMTFKAGFDATSVRAQRQEHLEYLKNRKALGHLSPDWTHQT